MENNIIITRPHEAPASLAELASQINAAHCNVETALRDGLGHARQAGDLLLKAKAVLPHGAWLDWIQMTCNATPRTVQRYMQLAEHWDEVTAKGGGTMGLHAALKLLTSKPDPQNRSNTTRASHSPPALAYLHDEKFINDEALAQLLELANDYGVDVLTSIQFDKILPSWLGDWGFLNAIRPLDHPPLWPIPIDGTDTAGTAEVVASLKIFVEDGRARNGKVPQWEVTALWFAATMVHFVDKWPKFKQQSGSILKNAFTVWRESFRTALVIVGRLPRDFIKDDDMLWWGYYSDLRHAGAAKAASEMMTNPEMHPTLFQSSQAGFEDWDRNGSYPMPSGAQGRLDRARNHEEGKIANDATEPLFEGLGPDTTADAKT